MRPVEHSPGAFGQQVEELFQQARQGSVEALGRLLEAFRQLLQIEAQLRLPKELAAKAGASDLVQETFLEAFRDFHQFQGKSPGEFLSWLRQILEHNAQNFQRWYEARAREQGREVSLDGPWGEEGEWLAPPAADPSPSSVASGREEVKLMRTALARLAAEDQEVIRLRHMEQMSHAEVAKELGLPSSDAAGKRFLRAIKKLSEALKLVRQETLNHPSGEPLS